MLVATVNVTSPAIDADCAAFTVAHLLGFTPSGLPEIAMKGLGQIAWKGPPFYDATNFYFQASGPSLDAVVKVYA
jgi:hypothetical protein